MYVVCQSHDCQQTYPLETFTKQSKNVSCDKCGGVLIDKDGRATFSHNDTVIPVVKLDEDNPTQPCWSCGSTVYLHHDKYYFFEPGLDVLCWSCCQEQGINEDGTKIQ